MKVTLNNGKTMEEADFIKERGFGDEITSFLATKKDLISLANAIVVEVLDRELLFKICVGRTDGWEYDYALFRLERVLDFLMTPEVEQIKEKLRLGREELPKRLEDYEASVQG